MKTTAITFLSIIAFSNLTLQANASEWKSQSQFKTELKRMKAAGKFPTSMQCRTNPNKRVFKAQIKVTWKNIKTKTKWAVYAYKGQLDFKPGPPEQSSNWKRVTKIVLKAGAGGSKFRCSLFHQK